MDVVEKINNYINELNADTDAYLHFYSKSIDVQKVKQEMLIEYNKVKNKFIEIYSKDPYNNIIKGMDTIFELLSNIKKFNSYKSASIETEMFQENKNAHPDIRASASIEIEYKIDNFAIDTLKKELSIDGNISTDQALEYIIDDAKEQVESTVNKVFKNTKFKTLITVTGRGPEFVALIEIDGIFKI